MCCPLQIENGFVPFERETSESLINEAAKPAAHGDSSEKRKGIIQLLPKSLGWRMIRCETTTKMVYLKTLKVKKKP